MWLLKTFLSFFIFNDQFIAFLEQGITTKKNFLQLKKLNKNMKKNSFDQISFKGRTII